MGKETSSRVLRRIEDGLIVVGLIALTFVGAAQIDRERFKAAALAEVNAAASPGDPNAGVREPQPNFSLWSPQRIKGYQESLVKDSNPVLGILRIPKLQIEAPIVEGTDELSLNRGVGHIAGTPELGEEGNTGFAGHRDGFFRGLKDIAAGDSVEIMTKTGSRKYVVDRILIVDPTDVTVLWGRDRESITLVTCYPFYFIGSAPMRFIVQASIVEESTNLSSANEKSKQQQ